MTRVMVLGCTGMLGGMVAEWLLRNPGFDLLLTARDPGKWASSTRTSPVECFDAEAPEAETVLARLLHEHRAEYVINCLGVIKPYCKDHDLAGRRKAVHVNAAFPYRLQAAAARAGSRVLQIATDCVYSGRKGAYVESDPHDALDVYGKTKSLGEVPAPNVLNLRCSIIGPERYHHVSLLGWFLSQPRGATVDGYAHHIWNGVTTLQFAQLCQAIMHRERGLDFEILRAAGPVHHFVPNQTVSKYELLCLFAEVYGRAVHIRRVDDAGEPVLRSLGTEKNLLWKGLPPLPMRTAVRELKQFADVVGFEFGK